MLMPDLALATARRRRSLVAVLACNVLEWFDFAVYGMLAVYLARAFFPQDSAHVGLLATLAVFGVSFVMRPLGALLLGGLGDGRGRKPALMAAAGLMAVSTFAIGLIPSHERIGMAAPLLLLATRLAQGFSAGGEWGVANAFLLESAPNGRRGFATSFMAATVALGSGLASALTAVLVGLLPAAAMESWGWRVPFLLGGVLGLIALWLRTGIDETPAYRGAVVPPAPTDVVLRRVHRPMLTVFGLTMHWTVCFYIFLIYLPLFTQKQGGLSPGEANWANTLSTLAILLFVPLVGHLSDRHGRRPFLMGSCVLILLLTLPALWSIANLQGFALIAAIQFLIGASIALYSGAAPAVVVELFATRDRSRWSSVAYALAAAVFGGFAPFIAVWLTGAFDSPLAPALYVMIASATSLFTIWHMPETAHLPVA
jgi:MHS family proline/betaine transporter-like MFS transporter